MPYHYLPPVPATLNNWQPPEEVASRQMLRCLFCLESPPCPEHPQSAAQVWPSGLGSFYVSHHCMPPFANTPITSV